MRSVNDKSKTSPVSSKDEFKRIKLYIKKRYVNIYPRINNSSKKGSSLLEATSHKISSRKIPLCILVLLLLCLYSLNNIVIDGNAIISKIKLEKENAQGIDSSDSIVKDVMSYHPHLPDYFNYKSIDESKLLEFLNARNSLLAEEPYFSAIIRASNEFNLNPHILFAITGQEQAFVPKDTENAQLIANNPFNVFSSWQEYNTDIYDSSRIAARTVINLAKDKPNDIDIFHWINNKYAADKNWGKGVKEIFESISH